MNTRSDRRRRLRVGVSVALSGDASAWEQEINQNAAFLALTLRQIDIVDSICLLCPALEQGALEPERLWTDVPCVRPSDVTRDLDLVIEVGARLPLEWLRHVRALGTKIVTLFQRACHVDLGEDALFERNVSYTFDDVPWHEVWTFEHLAPINEAWLRTIARVPVRLVPYLWSPLLINRRIGALKARGTAFGFQQPSAGGPGVSWTAAVYQGNQTVTDNYLVPMLACEYAHRVRPGVLSRMLVMNTFRMKEHLTFNRFASHLDLTRDGLASYEGALDVADLMMQVGANMLVTHHWMTDLGCADCEALYGGYPLVHNSPTLYRHGAGLYYRDFNASGGGEQILAAQAADADFWDGYAAAARRFVRSVSPTQDVHVCGYRHLIANLMEAPSCR